MTEGTWPTPKASITSPLVPEMPDLPKKTSIIAETDGVEGDRMVPASPPVGQCGSGQRGGWISARYSRRRNL